MNIESIAGQDKVIDDPRAEKIPSTPQEKILTTGHVDSSKKFKKGSTEPKFVHLKDDGSGIFKPVKNEELLGDWSRSVAGTFYKRERAAYIVDRFLELGLVPPTVIREVDGELGSLQEFISDTRFWGQLSANERLALNEQVRVMTLFDHLIDSQDRHEGNYLVKGDKIVAIDNGCSMGDYSEGPNYYNYLSKDTPQWFKDRIKVLAGSQERMDLLRWLLSELLSLEEVEAFFKRLRAIVDSFELAQKI